MPEPTTFRTDEAFAQALDAGDPLRSFREEFALPTVAGVGGKPEANATGSSSAVYLTGNSLGAMPKRVPELLAGELEDWARRGVEGHMHGRDPWLPYHEQFRGPLSRLVGGLEREVVAMNTLTTNLHLLMVSFYRPTKERFKIVIEDTAFPSDSYAVASQASFHGFDPASAVVRLKPRDGESTLRTEDIVATIAREKPALVMLGAVNYLTGQWFDMQAITRAGHDAGAVVGWDLAHAMGNVPMKLHDWGADFAAWCSYKYLNAGPGAVAGAFVHEKHLSDPTLPRFEGWWGNDPSTRFRMGPKIEPMRTADAWSLSNPPIFSLTPLKASLELFDRATMPALRAKALKLIGYMGELLKAADLPVSSLTPADTAQRGCQWSLVVPGSSKVVQQALIERGVVCDFREPNVIRAAPTPLYNSFHDVRRFVQELRTVLKA
ncbi:MAG: kynureninase [Tepidisphaera sp.]